MVVGGTTGIGRAISLGLAEAGADVVASARRPAEVDAVATEIERLGRRTLRVSADVTDRASLEQLRDQVLGAFGQVDILVNSAGKTKRVPTIDFPEDDWDAIVDDQPDRHAARLPDLRAADAGARLRARDQHRVGGHGGAVPRGGRLLRQQGRRGLADQVAGHRVGQPRRLRQRHRSRRVSHGAERRAARRHRRAGKSCCGARR